MFLRGSYARLFERGGISPTRHVLWDRHLSPSTHHEGTTLSETYANLFYYVC